MCLIAALYFDYHRRIARMENDVVSFFNSREVSDGIEYTCAYSVNNRLAMRRVLFVCPGGTVVSQRFEYYGVQRGRNRLLLTINLARQGVEYLRVIDGGQRLPRLVDGPVRMQVEKLFVEAEGWASLGMLEKSERVQTLFGDNLLTPMNFWPTEWIELPAPPPEPRTYAERVV
jgi:hypothetical protein